MRAFTAVCAGQTVSLLGTGMTGFALTIWAYLQTGSATTLALAAFFRFAPTVILSPIAGALVDRWNRKLTMMLSDLAAGTATVALLLLLLAGQLSIWEWYVAGAFSGAFEAFQWPAYSAAVTTMIPKTQYGRASGMLTLAQSASGILAPILGAALLLPIGLAGIMAIDIGTFLIAIGILLAVRIPQPRETEAGRKARGGLWKESAFGFRYIARRPSLLGLQLVFFAINLLFMLGFTVAIPMVLARTGNDSVALGGVESAQAVGGVAGGLAMSVWGGPKRRVHGVLAGMVFEGLFGSILLGTGQTFLVWAVAVFSGAFVLPIINGSNQAIWQAKVPPDIQGKVFSVRRLIAQVTAPVAMVAAGPLADWVFEPAMKPEGALAGSLGFLVGTGPGAGMGLMLVLFGILGALVGLAGYGVRVVREAETLLPDHDAEPGAAPPSGAESAEPAAAAGAAGGSSHAAKGEDPPPP